MLTIRLSRKGQRNRPMYRLVISEKNKDTYDRPLEFLGSYNPYSKELQAKEERIKYWVGQGAGMSPSVNNLLISQNIIEGQKIKASKSGKGEQEEKEPAKPEGEEASPEQPVEAEAPAEKETAPQE